MRLNLVLLLIPLLVVIPSASAHKTVDVGEYQIEVGWGDEPPVVGFRNFIVFEISKPGDVEGVKSGVKNAFQDLKATAKFGGVTKDLDIISEVQSGHYSSKIIPTRTGSIIIEFNGMINDVKINQLEIPIEDVEDTAILDFPPTTGSSSDQDIVSVKNALSAVQNDLNELNEKFGNKDVNFQFDTETAYNFSIVGMFVGISGIILATLSLIKHKIF